MAQIKARYHRWSVKYWQISTTVLTMCLQAPGRRWDSANCWEPQALANAVDYRLLRRCLCSCCGNGLPYRPSPCFRARRWARFAMRKRMLCTSYSSERILTGESLTYWQQRRSTRQTGYTTAESRRLCWMTRSSAGVGRKWKVSPAILTMSPTGMSWGNRYWRWGW